MVPETLGSSNQVMVVPVHSTVPLDESLLHPCLEVGHTKDLPNNRHHLVPVRVGKGSGLNDDIL